MSTPEELPEWIPRRTLSATKARSRFSVLLRQAQDGPVMITYDRPAAIVLSTAHYEALSELHAVKMIDREFDVLFEEMQNLDFQEALSVDQETLAAVARRGIAAERYD